MELYHRGEPFFSVQREIAVEADRDLIGLDEAERRIRGLVTPEVLEIAEMGARVQLMLHSQSLSALLICCFSMESHINSLAYFLFKACDFLGLVRGGRQSSLDVILAAIDRLSVREKWAKVAELKGGTRIDASRPPFQDLVCLFRFRDDLVHDKPVPIGEDRSSTRYNRKLPDPVGATLDLGHAHYGALTYWGVVQELHRLTDIPTSDFHNHYNVSPWFDGRHRQDIEELIPRYREVFPAG